MSKATLVRKTEPFTQEVSLQAYACQQLKYIEPFGNIKQSNRKSASAQQKVCQSAAAQLAKAMASDKSRFVTPYSSPTASSIMAAIIENIKIETTLGYCSFANPASREAIADDDFGNH
jgi:predicted transcriptional regulator